MIQDEHIPTLQEVAETITKLKNAKGTGSSNILPEMLRTKCKDGEFINMIVHGSSVIGKEGKVPKEWIDATLQF